MKPILCPTCGGLQREPSGAELRKLREAIEVTQDYVASALGVNRSYVSRVESGEKGATERLVRYYVKTFGAPRVKPSVYHSLDTVKRMQIWTSESGLHLSDATGKTLTVSPSASFYIYPGDRVEVVS